MAVWNRCRTQAFQFFQVGLGRRDRNLFQGGNALFDSLFLGREMVVPFLRDQAQIVAFSGVKRRSALSWRRMRRYSQREVIML